MSQEWISQTKAIKDFKLNVNDLHSNISKIVDGTKSKKFEGDVNKDKVKISKNPLVPLTLRLVDNPRGYDTPMRLYKISQLRELESTLKKFSEKQETHKPKIVKKQITKKIKNTPKPSVNLEKPLDSCDVLGHNFEILSETQEMCNRCKMIIESQTI